MNTCGRYVYADVEAVKKAGGPGAAALFASNWFGEQDGVRVSGAMGTGSMLAMLVRQLAQTAL